VSKQNKDSKNSLKQLNEKQLIEEIDKLRRELFSLKLAVVSSPPKDVTQFSKLRKSIARALTYLQEKRSNVMQEEVK